MTPRQKANQLFNRYQSEVGMFKFDAKHYALIAIEEIIEQLTSIEEAPNNENAFDYWEEVKEEFKELLKTK